MAKITEEQILKVAKLAKLSIDSKDLILRVKEFNDILGHIEKLNEIKTSAAPSVLKDAGLEMFEDEPKPSLPIEEVLKNAPSVEKPFFHIPRFIEGGKS